MTSPDLAEAMDRILETACMLTGARSAAMGFLDDPSPAGASRDVVERLAASPAPVLAYEGFDRFAGVPILVDGEGQGGLYVQRGHADAAFDAEDEAALLVLAEWAATAVEKDRLAVAAARRNDELARAQRTLRTALEIATAIGTDTDLTRTLELIAKRARALVDADGLLIWLRAGDELQVAVVAGHADVPEGACIPLDSTAGEALRDRRPVRIGAQAMHISPAEFGMPEATSLLIVPLVHRGRGLGVLMAFDRLGVDASFDADNERALAAFAAGAATAVATARLVKEQRLQDAIAAAESERGRWARELHDETLQGLGSLKLALSGALRLPPERTRAVLASLMERLDHDIDALRAIITDLRPAALDELGLEPALRTLVLDVAIEAGLDASVRFDLGAERLAPAVETIAYRVAQEALTNVVKHARAASVVVTAVTEGGRLWLAIDDDGCGVDGASVGGPSGYGIVGMRERAALGSGTIDITHPPAGGTSVSLNLPLD